MTMILMSKGSTLGDMHGYLLFHFRFTLYFSIKTYIFGNKNFLKQQKLFSMMSVHIV